MKLNTVNLLVGLVIAVSGVFYLGTYIVDKTQYAIEIRLGDAVDTVTAFPIPHPEVQSGEISGHIQHIDNFGNLITDIDEKLLSGKEPSVTILIKGRTISGISNSYMERSGPIGIIGSSGYLEISVGSGSAADYFQSKIGDGIAVQL